MEEIIDRAIAPDIHNMGRLSLPEAETMTLPNGLTLHFLSGGNADVSRIKDYSCREESLNHHAPSC